MGNLRTVAEDITNPEIRQLLDQMDPRGGSAPFSVEEKRKAYLAGVFRAGTPEPVASVEDRSIPGPGGDVGVRVYRPATEGELPVILYLHGGGFFSGDLDTHDPVCRFLANHVSAVVVGVDYRLAPDHIYPAAAQDCYAALRWIASSASTFGGDPSRIVVVGDSAGGNLAAVVALMARDSVGPELAAQILIYPMTDATFSFDSQVENGLIPPFTLIDCVYAWQLYLPHNVDRRHPYISPVMASSLSGVAPALILTAEFDILADEGEAYADRLRESGVAVEHEHFPGMVHGFFQWGAVVAGARLAMNRVVHYLRAKTESAASMSRA
jgi:acetyl esterase/lipase